MKENGVIIIGSGLAGYMTAKAFRLLDTTTPLTIITAQDGRFYSKPQLSTGLTHKKQADDIALFSAEQMAEKLDATILTHATVQSIDAKAKQVLLEDGQRLTYRDLVLAGGADVLHAPLAGDAVADVISVNHLQDYAHFRQSIEGKKHVAILGAGLVGCEYANDLLNAGFEVSLIAPDVYPLQRFLPEAIGRRIKQALADMGAQWYLQETISDVNHQGDQLLLTRCNQLGTIEADVVLSAIGFRPSEMLARTAGVACDRGVLVNASFETSVPNIYALGDCAVVDGRWLPFVAPINLGAKVLAKNLTGEKESIQYPVMPVVTKTPACPLVMVPPAADVKGEWQCEGEGMDLTASFIDDNGKLLGFALTGQCIRQRMEWMKRLA